MINEKFESRYRTEQPYLEQTRQWQDTMRYQYSPENYLVKKEQLQDLGECGNLVAELLKEKFGDRVLCFRIDYVTDRKGKLFMTEVQTDDRGFPAMAIARNARGRTSAFPGVIEPFMKNMQTTANKKDPDLLISFPDEEAFYYSGFYDVGKMLWSVNPRATVVVSPRSMLSAKDNQVLVSNNRRSFCMEPDLIWDFSQTLTIPGKNIQPVVNKQSLLDVWQKDSSLNRELRQFIPETMQTDNLRVCLGKDQWVLKPIDGRWSKGVVFGENTQQTVWEQSLREPNILAQRYINPRREMYYTRRKNGNYIPFGYFTRVEGYYSTNSEETKLADVLVTATYDMPVHGKRDCIMIPGKARKNYVVQ